MASSSSWLGSWSAWGSTLAADISAEAERRKAEREQAEKVFATPLPSEIEPALPSEPLSPPEQQNLIEEELPSAPANQSSLAGRLYEWKGEIEKEAQKLKDEIEKEAENLRELREAEVAAAPPPRVETSSGKEEVSFLDQTKEALARPIEVGDQNYNFLSKDVAESAKNTRESIIAEVNQMDSSLQKQAVVLGRDPSFVSTTSIAPSSVKPASVDLEKREKTVAVISEFEKRLTAYITFFTLHEIIAGKESPKNERGEPVVYQKMIQHAANHPTLTLWEIYYAELGARLDWLSYIKVRIFYFLFYSISNLIPKVTHELLEGVVQGLKERFSEDSHHLDNFAQASLSYGEVLLGKLSTALNDFGKGDKDSKASLDDQKAAAIMSLFREELPSLIQRVSTRCIDLFFPEIIFCEPGQTSSFVPVRFLGSVIGSLINWPMNILVKFILKRFVVPPVLNSMATKVLSDEPKEAYIFRRALYRVINQTLPGLSINKRSERKNHGPIPNGEKLKPIAAHLVKIFQAPDGQTQSEIRQYCEEIEKASPDMLQEALEEGIIKAGEAAVALLHDQNFLEDLFTKTLEATNEALVRHNNFAELQRDCLRQEIELYINLNNKLCTESRVLIQNIMNSNIQASDEKSENARAELQMKAMPMVIALQQNLQQMKQFAATADEYVNGTSEDPEGNLSQFLPAITLDRMKDFCNTMQDFTQQMDFTLNENIEAFAQKKESGLIQRIDRMLQPLREQGLVIMQSMSQFNRDQNEYYLHFVMYQEILQVLTRLKTIAKNLKEQDDSSELSSAKLFEEIALHLKKIESLSGQFKDSIPLEISQKMLEDAEKFAKELEEIDRNRALIRNLQSLADPLGPAGLLISFRQGKQSSALHNFDAEAAKRSVQEILESSDLYDELSPLVDQMLKFLPSTERKNFERLRQLVENQLSSDRLKEEFEDVFASQEWQTIPSGREFDRTIWNERKNEFLQTIRRKDFSLEEIQEAELILDQIEGFFYWDILTAYWQCFGQKIAQAQARLIGENEGKKRVYFVEISPLFDYLKERSQILEQKQKELLYPKLKESQADLQTKIDQFQKQTETLEIETPVSTDTTFKAAGAMVGAAVGLAAASILPVTAAAALVSAAALFASSFFRSDRWVRAAQAGAIGFTAALLPIPAALIGAAVGGTATAYAAKEIPQTAMDYADKNVIPRLQALIKKALLELLKSHTRRGLVYSGLEGFANGGYVPRTLV